MARIPELSFQLHPNRIQIRWGKGKPPTGRTRLKKESPTITNPPSLKFLMGLSPLAPPTDYLPWKKCQATHQTILSLPTTPPHSRQMKFKPGWTNPTLSSRPTNIKLFSSKELGPLGPLESKLHPMIVGSVPPQPI